MYRVSVLGLKPLDVYVEVYPLEKEVITTNNMKIKDISLYYNLQNYKSIDGIKTYFLKHFLRSLNLNSNAQNERKRTKIYRTEPKQQNRTESD